MKRAKKMNDESKISNLKFRTELFTFRLDVHHFRFYVPLLILRLVFYFVNSAKYFLRLQSPWSACLPCQPVCQPGRRHRQAASDCRLHSGAEREN
ncbi:MAG: hypothetical protein AB1742_11520, partial [bacterium]